MLFFVTLFFILCRFEYCYYSYYDCRCNHHCCRERIICYKNVINLFNITVAYSRWRRNGNIISTASVSYKIQQPWWHRFCLLSPTLFIPSSLRPAKMKKHLVMIDIAQIAVIITISNSTLLRSSTVCIRCQQAIN